MNPLPKDSTQPEPNDTPFWAVVVGVVCLFAAYAAVMAFS